MFLRGKCSRLAAILAHVHVEGQVFFSCLASLSGFLKDAKSVYLKQRLLACVKRRLMLYIRLLLFLLCVLFLFYLFSGNFYFTWIMNRYSYFVSGLIIYSDLNVLCKRSFMKSVNTYVHKYPVYYTFISVYVHAYLCVYDYMYKLRRNILTKD